MTKHTSATQTTAQPTTHIANRDSSAGPNSIAIAPPVYGIDIVDNQPIQTAPKQEPGYYPLESATWPARDAAIQRKIGALGTGSLDPRTAPRRTETEALMFGPKEPRQQRDRPSTHTEAAISPAIDRAAAGALPPQRYLGNSYIQEFAGHRPVLQRACACGGSLGPSGGCAECHKRQLDLQRSAAEPAAAQEVPPIVREVLRSPGQPLDTSTRAFMEQRFGQDFSRVRLHIDSRAAEASQAVRARAYTVGQNIVFNEAFYVPQSVEGRRLLAHELAHVVQQRASDLDNRPSGRAEQEASRAAERVLGGQSVAIRQSAAGVQRDPLTEEEIRRLNRAELERRLVQNEQEYQQGIYAPEYYEGLERENIALKAALSSAPATSSATARTGSRSARGGTQQQIAEIEAQIGAPVSRTPKEMQRLFERRSQLAAQLSDKDTTSAAAPSTSIPNLTVVRPDALSLQQSYTLRPIVDMDAGLASRLPEGRIAVISMPGAATSPRGGMRPTDITSPLSGTAMSGLSGINQTLMQSGFARIPGGNGIGLVGFPRLGTAGALVPESLSTWGHTAVYVRINGQVVVARGYMPKSLLEAALRQSGVQAGTEAIPAAISDDLSLFARTGARAIEYPVSAETATGFAQRLPGTGTPPTGGSTAYTGRPAVYGQPGATNCVGWACARIEGELGGRVGTVGPRGKVMPIAEPAYPSQGLQGRFMQATAEGAEIARLPGATGEAVVRGMPRYLQVLKWGGRVFIVVGGAMVIVETVQAPEGQRARTFTGAAGGFVGGLAAGAAAGLFCGPGAPVCSVVLGLGFGLAGYFGGRAAAETAYDVATE